jgi:hypothetical protein
MIVHVPALRAKTDPGGLFGTRIAVCLANALMTAILQHTPMAGVSGGVIA